MDENAIVASLVNQFLQSHFEVIKSWNETEKVIAGTPIKVHENEGERYFWKVQILAIERGQAIGWVDVETVGQPEIVRYGQYSSPSNDVAGMTDDHLNAEAMRIFGPDAIVNKKELVYVDRPNRTAWKCDVTLGSGESEQIIATPGFAYRKERK